MTLIGLVPFLVAMVGLLLYLFAGNGKAQQVGLVLFGAGMLVGLMVVARHVIRIG